MRLLFFLLLLGFLYQAKADYADCKHIIVGGGIGGIYTAHQLGNTSTIPLSDICIFEARNRTGGRIYSVRSEDTGRLMFDLGGADYNSGGPMPITDSIRDAFNLRTGCTPILNVNCDEATYYAKVRNGPLMTQNRVTRNSNRLRYYLLPDETYSSKQEFEQTSIWNILVSQLPLPANIVAKLSSKNVERIWIGIKEGFEYIFSHNVSMTDLKYWETDMRTAQYDGTTGEKIWFSEEKWKTFLETVDEAEFDSPEWIYYASKYGLFHNTLLTDFGDSHDAIWVDNDDNPIGYSTFIDVLLENFTAHGGRIFYGHAITSVRRPTPYNPNDNNDDKFVLEGVKTLSDGTKVPFKTRAKSAVLNMGLQDLNRLSRDSVMWVESEFDFEYVLKSYSSCPALKGYLHYQDPWWYRLLNGTNFAVTTDEPIHFFLTQQSWADCDTDVFKSIGCPSWTQFVYVDGFSYTDYWDSANVNRTDGPIWLDPNDRVTAPFLDDAHQQMLMIYSDLLEEAGIDPASITPPDRGAMAFWEGGWAYLKTNDLNGRHNRLIRKPLQMEGNPSTPGDQLCIVNTDVSGIQGDAEGSLISALEALRLCYDVKVPNFPNSFYNNIIDPVW